MKAHLGSHDMVAVGAVFFDSIFSRHLDHGLVCLRTGILEIDFIHADGGADLFRQKRLRDGIRIVERMHQGLRLIHDSLHDFLVAAARRIDGDARIKIEIFFSFFIIDILILGCLRQEIKPFIGLDHIFVYFVFNILCGQSRICQFHNVPPCSVYFSSFE